MFEVSPLIIDDIAKMIEQPMNVQFSFWKNNNYRYAKHLASNSLSFTATVDDEPMLCAFFVELWNKRAYGAFVMSEEIKKHSVQVYRGLRNYIPTLPFNRIEIDCPLDLEIAHRRAKFLGFEVMCERAKRYLPDGSDATIYEWVR